MNILFISDNRAESTSGGVARAISNLALHFQQSGNVCYHVYFGLPNDIQSSLFFCKELILQDNTNVYDAVKTFILEESIDIVISNLMVKRHIKICMPVLNRIKSETIGTRYCFYYHSFPGNEMRCLPPSFLLKRLMYTQGRRIDVILSVCKSMLISFFPILVRKYLKRKYVRVTDNENNLILLSESYKREFAKVIQMKHVPSQWHCIPNAVSFSTGTDLDIGKKERIALIVARLDEDAKRLTIALKIWDMLFSKYCDIAEWRLVIVGDGIDRPIYERMVAQMKIPNVTFTGRQDSLSYYQKASVFLMTSAYEGFPMTLLESMQCGCPPIAFDTFSAINDLIEDGENGFVIESENKEKYVEKLHLLMQDNFLRETMALNGMKSVQRYSVENVTKMWYAYFEKLKASE